MMREILYCVVLLVVAALLPATAHGDDFYYCLDSAVHVAISSDFIAVQFDTTRPVPSMGTFLASYPCLSGDNPEPIGRGFWSVPLATQCGYSAAYTEISADPALSRVFPVYRTASSDEGLPVTDEITVRFVDDLAIDSALAILAAEGLRFIDSSAYRHNLWYCALEETVKTSPLE